jgi:hypothetical protein
VVRLTSTSPGTRRSRRGARKRTGGASRSIYQIARHALKLRARIEFDNRVRSRSGASFSRGNQQMPIFETIRGYTTRGLRLRLKRGGEHCSQRRTALQGLEAGTKYLELAHEVGGETSFYGRDARTDHRRREGSV